MEVVQGRAATAAAGVEGNMPWKKDGEKWHLGEKGFPPGQGAKWDRALLPKLVKLLREIDPNLELKWDVRDAVTIRPRGQFAVLVPDQDEGVVRAGSVVRRPPRADKCRQARNLSGGRRRSKATATTAARC